MASCPLIIDLATPDETASLARAIASALRPGDVILMEGGIGAGKTHFARALIQSLLPEPEDVPSPTFTLVQVYDTPDTEIWHTDLYRLTGPDEAVELGLEDAFETAICLVEWPDRLAELAPDNALTLSFEVTGDEERRVICSWSDNKWNDKLDGVAP
ncbi:tRNA (adenosine(37)-N6)-threonylcarbamoyltransferase complex ATPase subunit type 1 TsaE [Thalassovita aquimarina]|uniref:tRNA threonylcarbamoyladenosine biosynthesis protein TsaE n=1 Tax=Thalassovita aquimarina TaxID=2785917 RepID=A0ABS5HN68_9RHOB|nr:tRNA (adenosine(37)-N6)-threonylcarbamoyltransferase complex ATPase subunit type 1 TsaE [Thalassovita aquimarina]MBR9650400.1 tRNA (adenosine(37)-N6)-threonylcarbamoyltransferase complex ATPase subunit type 1 TsaE [Thalassovita aquimarina]